MLSGSRRPSGQLRDGGFSEPVVVDDRGERLPDPGDEVRCGPTHRGLDAGPASVEESDDVLEILAEHRVVTPTVGPCLQLAGEQELYGRREDGGSVRQYEGDGFVQACAYHRPLKPSTAGSLGMRSTMSPSGLA